MPQRTPASDPQEYSPRHEDSTLSLLLRRIPYLRITSVSIGVWVSLCAAADAQSGGADSASRGVHIINEPASSAHQSSPTPADSPSVPLLTPAPAASSPLIVPESQPLLIPAPTT